MEKNKNRAGRNAASVAALYGLLIALAMVFSFIESLFPAPALAPGVKLGLANLVTVSGLYLIGIPGTVCVTLMRVVLVGLSFGNPYSMVYGLSGSLLSLIVMASVRRLRLFSILGVSVLGGIAHNVGQTAFAAVIVGTPELFYYLPALLMAGCISGALIGIPTLGFWHMGNYVYVYLLVSVLSAAALSAIFTFIGMLCPNKAMCAVAAIVLFLILMAIAFMLYNALSQPEFTDSIALTADGMQFGDPVPNPSYVSGTKREVYQFMLDVLPTGQCIQIFDLSIAHPLRMIVSSISILAGVSLCGIGIFHKKNIR